MHFSRIRITGLALVAVFAMSMTAAAAAVADDEFVGTGTTAKSIGTQTFTTNAGKVECEATYTITNEKTQAKALFKYTNCKAFGFIGAEVKNTNCEYLFEAPEDNTGEVEGETEKFHHGTVSFIKGKGTEACKTVITVSGTTCKVTVETGENAKLSKITYLNNSKKAGNLEIKAEVKGITYTQSAACSGGAGTFHNGEYVGANEAEKLLIN